MCFISKEEPKRLIAETDVRVFKVLSKHERPDGIIQLYTPIQCMQVEFGILQEPVPLFLRMNNVGDYVISRGYHSFSTYKRAKHFIRDYSSSIIFIAYIPEGCTYYINEYNEVVSENLRITNEIANEE